MDLSRRTLIAASGALMASCSRHRAKATAAAPTKPLRLPGGMLPVEPQFFGIHWVNNPDGPLGLGQKTFGYPNNVRYLDLGGRTARLWDTFTSWRLLEPEKGQFDFSRLDAYLSDYKSLNIDVILTFGQAPDWAAVPSYNKYGLNPNPPTNIQDWKDYVQAVVRHCKTQFPGVVVGYEIWNEPDQTIFWTGTMAQLVDLTRAAAPIIRSIDPLAKVLCAAISSVRSDKPRDYLRSYLSLLKPDDFDVFSIHGYGSALQPETSLAFISEIQDILAPLGFAQKPWWITEFSVIIWFVKGEKKRVPAEVMDEKRAASYLARMFFVFALSGAQRAIFYGLNFKGQAILMLDLNDPAVVLQPAKAFQYLAYVLAGVGNYKETVVGTGVSTFSLHSMEFASRDGRSGTCFWCDDDQSTTVDLSAFRSATDVLGGKVFTQATSTIDMTPVFAFR